MMEIEIIDQTGQDIVGISELVLGGITNPNTRRAYESDSMRFIAWWNDRGNPNLSKAVINQFKRDLVSEGVGPAAVNRNLSAVKKMVSELEDNGVLNPVLARGIQRVEGIPIRGKSTANWLTKEDAQEMLRLPDLSTLKGVRDRAILSVLIGCGLRRDELVSLLWEDVQQREGRWVVIVKHGKRNKRRIVPMAPWTKVALDEWDLQRIEATVDQGFDLDISRTDPIFNPVSKGGYLHQRPLSVDGVYALVKGYAAELDLDIKPHDLRRTFAKLARRGGAHLEQIQYSLGHDSIETTMKYIGEDQDFNQAPCDALGLEV